MKHPVIDRPPIREIYDVIVVGARAAGAATAMLLARQGLRVLAVDRAAYGSDTLSTHALMRGGVLQLSRWGLLDAVRASGAPPVRRVVFHYPAESVAVELKPSDGVDALYAPRRTVLDQIVADAAVTSGADVRFGVAVEGLLRDERGRVNGISARDDTGRRFAPRARIVVGADGIRSLVAREAAAPTLRQAQTDGAVVYGYFKNVEASGFEWVYGPQVSAGLIPTNNGEVCVFVGGSSARFRKDVLPDIRQGFHSVLQEASAEVAGRVRAGEPTARFRGFADVRGFYRRSWGEGWALVGDAGYFRDPITTHGLTDAFRDAELLARAISSSLISGYPEAAALGAYEQARNDATADLFAVTERIASYDWTLDEVRGLLREVSRAMKAEMDVFARFDTPSAESAA